MENKTCETCFWSSKDLFCTEGGRPPQKCKETCDKYKEKVLKDSR